MPDFHLTVPTAVNIVLSGVFIYLAVIVATRLAGLRSFAKMSSFDFAMTVAVGSVIAATLVNREAVLLPGMIAIAVLYALQMAVGRLRMRFTAFQKLVDNEPVLLMDGATLLEDNLRHTGVTRDDLRAKLREANVLRLSQVRAVVLETTGDISVLHSDDAGVELEPELLKAVRRQPGR